MGASAHGAGAGTVAVLGAGVVGACCAVYLQRAGCRVVVVDRQPPGEASSFGNAGSLSPASCVPIATPGLLAKVPGWLLDRDGPLTVRWRHLPGLLPWLVRYVRAGSTGDIEAAADALHALHAPTVELHQELARAAGVPELVRGCAYLHVYRSEEDHRRAALEWRLRADRGVRFEVLDARALHEHEPDLSPEYRVAVRIPDQGYTLNPSRLVKALVEHVVASGGELRRAEVTGFETSGDRVTAVRTAAGSIPVDAAVIASGAWSHRLAAMLGVRVPLEAERGYHVTLPEPGVTVRHTIMETAGKFVATPMEMGLRFAGTVELASVDTPPDYRRADAVLRGARRMFPTLRAGDASRWMGCRPSLPDGLPVIGPSPRQRNVWLAFGHAHTGMVGAPMTGRMIAGLVTGRPLNVDPAPYRADRF